LSRQKSNLFENIFPIRLFLLENAENKDEKKPTNLSGIFAFDLI